jgi:hypothetical protein
MLQILFIKNELSFMNKPALQIQNAGANKCVAGGNQNWCGSTRQLMISSLKQIGWHWPPNRQQRRYLS